MYILLYKKDDSQDKTKKQKPEPRARSFLQEQGHREEVLYKVIAFSKIDKIISHLHIIFFILKRIIIKRNQKNKSVIIKEVKNKNTWKKYLTG